MAAKFNATVALFLILAQVLCLTFANACTNCASLTPSGATCRLDVLQLQACANVLGLIQANVGKALFQPCCNVLENLGDLEAAVCLCTAIKDNILGINLNVDAAISLVLNNYCSRPCP